MFDFFLALFLAALWILLCHAFVERKKVFELIKYLPFLHPKEYVIWMHQECLENGKMVGKTIDREDGYTWVCTSNDELGLWIRRKRKISKN